jgi:hypothetical protein
MHIGLGEDSKLGIANWMMTLVNTLLEQTDLPQLINS